MSKIRVLIIDDAVVVRRIVADVLSADPVLEVVGTAANGKIGLSKIPNLNPDVITLDVEMPEMDGLETLAAIRTSYPRLPVIMFSTLTQRGAASTLDALTLGANDYVTKPANVGSFAAALQSLREQLIPKIKAHCTNAKCVEPARSTPSAAQIPVSRTLTLAPQKQSVIDIVAVGISTGGPNALCEVLPRIPSDFPVPIVIVQHMPPMFTKLLAERLDKQSGIRVHEGEYNSPICPGNAYLAPGNFHMMTKRLSASVTLALHQGPPENSCRPAVDVLFRSVAEVYGAGTLGVIMTGMGQDGLRGCEMIRSVGGQVIAQDEATSVVWGMPGFVARAGLADAVLPLDQIATEICQRVQRSRLKQDSKRAVVCS